MPILQQPSQFTYCHSQQSYENMVMLCHPKYMLQKYAKSECFHFVWLLSHTQSQLQLQYQYQQIQGEKVQQSNKLGQVKRIIKQIYDDYHIQVKQCIIDYNNNNNHNNQTNQDLISVQTQLKLINLIQNKQNLVLIFSQQISKFVTQITACIEYGLTALIMFPAQSEQQTHNDIVTVVKTNSQRKLLNSVHKIIESVDTDTLPNFISLRGDTWVSNLKVKTMLCMTNQQQDKSIRHKIINKFKQLVTDIANQSEQPYNIDVVLEFLQQLEQGPMDVYKAVQWYTRQTPIYSLVNSILRSSNHPAQAYYIQPYFKDLSSGIRKYGRQNKIQTNKQLRCYRGGRISYKQFQLLQTNLGAIVQNLGFLSTTLKKQKMEEYKDNLQLQIIVPAQQNTNTNININGNTQQKIGTNFGFALIQKLSHYFQESEVLFNPLNSFLVLQCTSSITPVLSLSSSPQQQVGQCSYFIKLKYGELQRVVSMADQQLSIEQKHFKQIGLMQQKEIQKLTNQGGIFAQYNYLQGCHQYFDQKFKHLIYQDEKQHMHQHIDDIVEDGQQECEDDWQSVSASQDSKQSTCSLPQQYQSALKAIKQLMQIQLKLNEGVQYKTKRQKINTLLSFQQKYNSIKQALHNTKQMSLSQADSFRRRAEMLQKLGQDDKAMQMYKRCLQIQRVQLGYNQPSFALTCKMIAKLLHKNGKINQAYDYYKYSANVYSAIYGQASSDYLDILMNLAKLYSYGGYLQKVYQCYMKCFKLFRQLYGKSHRNYASLYNNMGNYYCNIGQYNIAVQMQQQAININMQKQQKRSPRALIALLNMANIFQQISEYNKVLQLYQVCIKLQNQAPYYQQQQYTHQLVTQQEIQILRQIVQQQQQQQQSMEYISYIDYI